MWKMEGLISEAKQRHCLSRAKYKGLIKTQIQAYMVASALNMKRLVTFFILLFSYVKILQLLQLFNSCKIEFNKSGFSTGPNVLSNFRNERELQWH